MSDSTPHPVFISYARKTSRDAAVALHRALGRFDVSAFLDTSDIEAGEHFPKALLDALLSAKVVVAFVDETYFKRWYCLRELRTALAPYHALFFRGSVAEHEKEQMLAHLVLALPQKLPDSFQGLPPKVKTANWPPASDIPKLAELVRKTVNSVVFSLDKDIGDDLAVEGIRATLLGEAALPPPINLAGRILVPSELPVSLHDGFVGRADDLAHIHYRLTTMRGEPATSAALTGALEAGGGFGKTRMALEYLHRFGSAYPGGLFWIDADVSDDQLQRRFHGILHSIRPDTPALLTMRERFRATQGTDEGFAEELRSILGEALHQMPPEKPALFVVDNVPEAPAGSRPKPFATWCPAMGKVSLLATSRAKAYGSGVIALPVDTLDRKSAVALLTHEIDRSSLAESEWERIAEWVGDLPLALELLQQGLKAGAISPRELFERSNRAGTTKELDDLMSAVRDQVPQGSLRGVTEALQISYERLPAKAQKLARLLAFLSPDPIPMAIIEALGEDNAPADSRAALISRSFITRVPGGGVPLFGKMHRVLADFLRGCSDAPEVELAVVEEALSDVMNPNECRDPKNWPLMNSCVPHAEWLFERFDGNPFDQRVPVIVNLGQSMGILFGAQGVLQRSRKLGERTLDLALRVLGEEHPCTLASMSNLAETLRAQGAALRVRANFKKAHSSSVGACWAKTIPTPWAR